MKLQVAIWKQSSESDSLYSTLVEYFYINEDDLLTLKNSCKSGYKLIGICKDCKHHEHNKEENWSYCNKIQLTTTYFEYNPNWGCIDFEAKDE